MNVIQFAKYIQLQLTCVTKPLNMHNVFLCTLSTVNRIVHRLQSSVILPGTSSLSENYLCNSEKCHLQFRLYCKVQKWLVTKLYNLWPMTDFVIYLQSHYRQIFRIGTVHYAEGLWRMRRHGPVIAHCTDSEDSPHYISFCSSVPYLILSHLSRTPAYTAKSIDIWLAHGFKAGMWWLAFCEFYFACRLLHQEQTDFI